jgi:hypothetical protein
MTHAPTAIMLRERPPLRPVRKRRRRSLRRGLRAALGYALLAVGLVGAVLPFHLGLPVMAFGLTVLLRNSMRARRTFVRLQRRWPNWIHPVRRLLRPQPEFAPVIWHAMLRSERLLFTFARNWRVLKRLRRVAQRQFRR